MTTPRRTASTFSFPTNSLGNYSRTGYGLNTPQFGGMGQAQGGGGLGVGGLLSAPKFGGSMPGFGYESTFTGSPMFGGAQQTPFRLPTSGPQFGASQNPHFNTGNIFGGGNQRPMDLQSLLQLYGLGQRRRRY